MLAAPQVVCKQLNKAVLPAQELSEYTSLSRHFQALQVSARWVVPLRPRLQHPGHAFASQRWGRWLGAAGGGAPGSHLHSSVKM